MENIKNIYGTKEMVDKLMSKAIPAEYPCNFGGYEIKLKESSIFPFEITYDACDIETRHEVKIPSGEWCHGVMLPDPDMRLDPIFEFEPFISPLTEFKVNPPQWPAYPIFSKHYL